MYQRIKARLIRFLAATRLLGAAIWLKGVAVGAARRANRVVFGFGRSVATLWARGLRRVRRWRAHRILRHPGPGEVIVYHEDHWCVAMVDPAMRQIDSMERNVALLAGILDRLKVPYALIPALSTHRLRIAVSAAHRKKVLRHLVSTDDGRLHLRFAGTRPWLGVPAVHRPPGRLMRKGVEVRVYHATADPSGSVVFGSLVGCSLEFWRQSREGVLTTTLGDTRVATATQAEFGAARIDVGGIAVRTLPVVAEKTLFSTQDFPVDLVYTWVDGSDPAWRRRKAEVTGRLEPGRGTVDSDTPERFVHRDELLFSLRSVSQFAEFVRHVYLVTDRQVPEWLDTSCPRVTVVDHRDIFSDPACLPTFNSHAIESRLHHIEGLSEHFVYMNDDFLFGRRVMHTNFYHPNGIAKFFTSHAVLSGESLSVDHAARNAADLLEGAFGVRVTNKMKHAPYAQRRSTLAAMEERFAEAFTATAHHQVRSPDDIPVASSMAHYFGSFIGKAVPGTIANAYVDIGKQGFEVVLSRISVSRRYDVICLNDTGAREVDGSHRDAAVRRWLDSYFPVPGEFEKS